MIPLRLLMVEDSEDDALLVLDELRRGGYAADARRVETADDMRAALRERAWDLVISDFQLPQFDGLAALAIRNQLAPDVPLLVVSGTIGEDVAVGAMRAGAQDYIMKGSLKRLVPAIRRELAEVETRRARAAAEAELERTRERLQRVLAATKDTIYDVDVAADRTWYSDALQAWGYSERVVQPGLAWWRDKLHPDDGPSVEVSRLRALEARQPVWSREYRLRKQDGGWAHVLDRCHVLYEDGRAARIIGCLSDLTELRRLEAQFHQAQKMETIGQLAGGVAHDFNNLLTAIAGYSELVQSRFADGDPGRGEVEEIKKAGQRAAGLVRQLLAFSRRQHLEPKVLDVNGVVRDMDAMLRRLIGGGIKVSTVLAPELGRVRADPGQLGQVLMNLAVNARDAMADLPPGAGRRLTIETADVELDPAWATTHVGAQPGRHVMLAVSDTGHGMDEATKARIFEPFFTTKAPGAGTGLGLATVYGIVRQSGGTIWVYSEPGHGATFKVYLPRVDGPAEDGQRPRDRAAAAPARAAGETVLVAEDEEGVRALIQRVLELQGYRVLVARDGAEALDLCRRHDGRIDLAVADLVMPGMGGQELAGRLGELRPGLRVLHLSGFAGGAITERGALPAGAPFLQKPFTPDLFARKVREVLDTPAV